MLENGLRQWETAKHQNFYWYQLNLVYCYKLFFYDHLNLIVIIPGMKKLPLFLVEEENAIQDVSSMSWIHFSDNYDALSPLGLHLFARIAYLY